MKSLPLFTLLITLMSVSPLHLEARTWSEQKFGKTFTSINRDLDRKRWIRVIDRSQAALPHCIALHTERDQRCIILLRNINLSYVRTRRLNPDSEQIRQAYVLAKDVLGVTHMTTNTSREIYYHYFLVKEDYASAIPLAIEILEVEEAGRKDRFEILARVEQLYALYGLTEQWVKEETTLRRLLIMTEELIGKDSEDYRAVATALSENYCIQKKWEKFFELVEENNLVIDCSAWSD